METVGWTWPLLAALAASGAALLGSALVLALGERAERAAVWLLSYAIGTLLAAAMLHLLPEALELGPQRRATALFLGGIVAFIAFERLLRWRTPHAPHPLAQEHPAVERATAAMILWGDALHNLADGLVLGAAFAAGREAGLVAAVAVFAHEVPQEIGDFAILLGAGYSRRRALFLNWLSALTTVPGAALAFGWASASREVAAWLLPVSAGILTHIALADLVPAVDARRGGAAALAQVGLVLAGVLTIAAVGTGHGH